MVLNRGQLFFDNNTFDTHGMQIYVIQSGQSYIKDSGGFPKEHQPFMESGWLYIKDSWDIFKENKPVKWSIIH